MADTAVRVQCGGCKQEWSEGHSCPNPAVNVVEGTVYWQSYNGHGEGLCGHWEVGWARMGDEALSYGLQGLKGKRVRVTVEVLDV